MDDDEKEKCDVCGCKFPPEKLKVFQVKGEEKKICRECLDSVHGLA